MSTTPGEPTLEEQKALGVIFPAEWVAPVLRVQMKPTPTITDFCGTATLLGGPFFLTARHVIEDSLAERELAEEEFFCVNVFSAEGAGEQHVRRIAKYEYHRDAAADLAFGRFADWYAQPPWNGIGFGGLSPNCSCYGFPKDLRTMEGPQGIALDARSLQGNVQRVLAPNTFDIHAPSLELSFPITEGMSGSPVYAVAEGTRTLLGMALGSQTSYIAQHQTVLQLPGETPQGVYRVVEYGVAIRLSAFVEWMPEMISPITLGQLLAPETGALDDAAAIPVTP